MTEAMGLIENSLRGTINKTAWLNDRNLKVLTISLFFNMKLIK